MNKGFPRKNGHCAAHDISGFLISLLPDDFPIEDYQDELYNDNRDILDKVLNKMLELKIDLVRGDLICNGLNEYRNDGVCIFNGEKIIPLNYEIDDYGSLPSEFTVINDNVPIRYWEDSEKYKGIDHNCHIWFDIDDDIRKQLVENIDIDKYCTIYTTFILNNKKYYIIDVYCDDDSSFEYTLKKKSKLLLNYNEDIYVNDGDSDNTVYIDEFNQELDQ